MPNRAPSSFEMVRPARRPRLVAALALALGALPAVGLRAQVPEPEPPVNVTIEGDYLVLSVGEKEGMDLRSFIKLAQQLTNKVFIYSEQDIANNPDNKVTFIGPKRIKKSNFFAFFQTILYIKGFATLIHGDEDTEIIEIIFRSGPKRPELSTTARYVPPEEIPEYANQTGVQILTSVPLKYTNAVQAQNQLRPFFLGTSGAGQSNVTFGAAGQALLLQGFGPQVYAAYQLLQLVDVPLELPEQEIKIIKLEHAATDEIEPILKEILEDRSKRQQQATGVSGAELTVQQPGELKIVPHASLNAILLSGTRQQIVEGQQLIAELDIPVEASGGDTHVIALKNVLANEMYETLNKFIQDDVGAERQAQAGQGQAAVARQPRRTVVVAHEATNSLLVSGTSTKYKELQRLIDELDRRQPQVLIECAVIELTTQDSYRLGVELGLVDLPASGEFKRPFGFTSFGLSSFTDEDGNGIPDTRSPVDPLPQGFLGGIVTSDDVNVPILVSALAADSKANILSTPSVVVNNNENALVRNQEQRPQQTVSQGNATTQSGAGTPQSAGITLNISPSISSNNYLRLNIDLTVSRFTTPFDPNAVTAGVVAERQIQTQVTMPSGHTMVLGGVIEDSQSDTSSGIPLLKDIPILGWLFQTKGSDKNKTNLYFFLTPYILDEEDFSDLAEQSFRKKLEAAEYIGNRRIQLIDRKWRPGRPETLDDPGATIEDLDARGGFDIPFYQRPERNAEKKGSTAPKLPDSPVPGATPSTEK